MRAGLAASTVTPGSTAPPSSRTTPAIVPLDASCADAVAGTERRITAARTLAGRSIASPPLRVTRRRAYSFIWARSLATLRIECNAFTLTAAAAPHTFARMLKPRAPRRAAWLRRRRKAVRLCWVDSTLEASGRRLRIRPSGRQVDEEEADGA